MIGRRKELEAIGKTLDTAHSGTLELSIIEGEPGIGKSTLLSWMNDRATEKGFRVLRGATFELESRNPFAPLIRALGMGPQGSVTPYPDQSNWVVRMQDQVLQFIEDTGSTGPLLLALDDLQWADPYTIATLAALRRDMTGLPIALGLAMRTHPRSDELRRFVFSLVEEGATHLKLLPLDDLTLKSLIEETLGRASPHGLVEQAIALGGNPLLALELAEAVRKRGESETPSRDFAHNIRAALLSRVGLLSNESTEALRLASILGTTFMVEPLSAIAGKDLPWVMRGIDEAVGHGVLVATEDAFAFRHDLIREAVYGEIAPSTRRALHSRAADYLDARGASTFLVAPHIKLASSAGDLAAGKRLTEIGRLISKTAPAEAVRVFEDALEVIPPSDALKKEVLADMMLPLAWIGDMPSIKRAEEIAALVISSGADAGLMHKVRRDLIEALVLVGRYHEAGNIIDRRLGAVGFHESELSDLLAAKCYLLAESRQIDTAVSCISEAERVVPGEGHASFLVSMARVILRYVQGYPQDALRMLDELLGPSSPRKVTSPLDGIRANYYLASIQLNLDEFEAARQSCYRGLLLCEDAGSAIWRPNFLDLQARSEFLAGRWDESLVEAESAISLARDLEWPSEWLTSPGLIATIKRSRADVDEALRILEEFDVNRAAPASRFRVLLARGEEEDLLRSLDVYLTQIQAAGDLAFDVRSVTPRVLDVCARLQHTKLLMRLASEAEKFAERSGVQSAIGMAFLARGIAGGDSKSLVQAVESFGRPSRPYEAALAYELAGTALAHNAAHRHLSEEVLRNALSEFESLGCVDDAARVRARMRQLGMNPPRRSRRSRHKIGWEALTPTELRVAELARQRLTTPEIAAQLFISRRTVQTHLRHIFSKLGISSRADLRSKGERPRE